MLPTRPHPRYLSSVHSLKTGFTIVELLIVIVVIGILAAITIVAYNGVQARANTTKNDTLAKEIANKAEVYAADNSGVYPTRTQLSASVGTGALSLAASNVINATTAQDKVQFLSCDTGSGFKVTGWNYSTKAASTTVRTGGIATGTCV